jgi:hypothetical protein
MSLAKLAVASGLIAVALFVSACGIQASPVAGTKHLNRAAGDHTYVNDPRTPFLRCLKHTGMTVTKFDSGPEKKLRSIQLNSKPDGPTVVFEPTPGIAEGDQMEGEVTGAEVLGSALIYPNRASDKTMIKVESCLATKVNG